MRLQNLSCVNNNYDNGFLVLITVDTIGDNPEYHTIFNYWHLNSIYQPDRKKLLNKTQNKEEAIAFHKKKWLEIKEMQKKGNIQV